MGHFVSRSGISPRSGRVYSFASPPEPADRIGRGDWFVYVYVYRNMYTQHRSALEGSIAEMEMIQDAGPCELPYCTKYSGDGLKLYNGCGDVTTLGCTMLSAIAIDAPSSLNKRMTVKYRVTERPSTW